MGKQVNLRLVLLVVLLNLGAAGCSTAPVQEMSDARQAVTAARDAGAAQLAAPRLNEAQQALLQAQDALHHYRYKEARQQAQLAKTQAIQARNDAVALARQEQRRVASAAVAAARRAVQETAALEGLWRDTEKILQQAETALAAGDYATAQTQAATAERQAQLASNQVYLEKTRYLINAAKARRHLNSRQRATLHDAETALAKHAGKQAYALINSL